MKIRLIIFLFAIVVWFLASENSAPATGSKSKLMNMRDLTASPDGDKVAVAISRGYGEEVSSIIAEYDLEKKTLSKLQTLPGIWVIGMKYSPDGALLFADVGEHRPVRSCRYFLLVDTYTGEVARKICRDDFVPCSLDFAVSVNNDLYTWTHKSKAPWYMLKRWNFAEDKIEVLIKKKYNWKKTDPFELQYIPSPAPRGTLIVRIGPHLAVYVPGEKKPYQSSGKVLGGDSQSLWDFAISPNGRRLAQYSDSLMDPLFFCFGIRTNTNVPVFFEELPERKMTRACDIPYGISEGVFSADGALFAGIQGLKESDDSRLFEPKFGVEGTARVYICEPGKGKLVAKLETGYVDELSSLSFLGDSNRLISLDKAGRLHLWELPDTDRKEIIPDWGVLFEGDKDN